MGFPVVSTTNSSVNSTAGTSHTVNLPASIASGDLLIVCFAESIGTGGTVSFPAGWTGLTEVNSGTLTGERCGYRIADGTEGSTIAVTTSASTKSAHQSFRITSWHGTTPPENISKDSGGTSSANPTLNSLTPSWGLNDTLWIEACFTGSTTAATAGSTNYTNFVENNSTGAGATTNASCSTARRNNTTATEAPDAFTMSSLGWVTELIGIRPAASGTTFQITLAGTTVSVDTFAKIPTFPKVLAATGIGVSTLTTLSTFFKTLSAVEVSVLTLLRGQFVALSATGVSITSLTRKQFITLVSTAVGFTTVVVQSVIGITLNAVEVSVTMLAKIPLIGLTLASTVVSTATLTKLATLKVLLEATAISIDSFVRRQFVLLVGTIVSVPTVTKLSSFFRLIAATAVSVPILTKIATFPKLVAATATAVTALSLQLITAIHITLAATGVGIATLSRNFLPYTVELFNEAYDVVIMAASILFRRKY